MVKLFAVTFQMRYNRDVHPVIPKVNGNSYLIVAAESEMEAREFLQDKIGNDYAFLYEYDEDFVYRQIPDYNLRPVVGPWDTDAA